MSDNETFDQLVLRAIVRCQTGTIQQGDVLDLMVKLSAIVQTERDALQRRITELQAQTTATAVSGQPPTAEVGSVSEHTSESHEVCKRHIAHLETQLERVHKQQNTALPEVKDMFAADTLRKNHEQLEETQDKTATMDIGTHADRFSAPEAIIENEQLKHEVAKLQLALNMNLQDLQRSRQQVHSLMSASEQHMSERARLGQIIKRLQDRIQRSRQAPGAFAAPKGPSRDATLSRNMSATNRGNPWNSNTTPTSNPSSSRERDKILTGNMHYTPDHRDRQDSVSSFGAAVAFTENKTHDSSRLVQEKKRAASESTNIDSAKKIKADDRHLSSDDYPQPLLRYDETL